jgi:hypothetical protein
MCSGKGVYATDAGHPIWGQMLFGTESKLVTCPLCEGSREVEDEDEDFLMKHPWKAGKLIEEAERRAREAPKD